MFAFLTQASGGDAGLGTFPSLQCYSSSIHSLEFALVTAAKCKDTVAGFWELVPPLFPRLCSLAGLGDELWGGQPRSVPLVFPGLLALLRLCRSVGTLRVE